MSNQSKREDVATKRYRALKGLNYPSPKPGDPDIRVEPGEDVEALPARKVPELLKLRAIEEISPEKEEAKPVVRILPVEEKQEGGDK